MRLNIPGICGWFGPAANDAAQPLLRQMVAAQPWQDTAPAEANEHCGLAAPGGALWSSGDGLTVAVIGAPDWENAKESERAGEAGLAAAIGMAYRVSGDAFLQHLGGEFALAVFDAKTRSGLIVVDRFARRPLYWAHTTDRLVFGGSADAVLAQPAVATLLDPQELYHYLFFHMVPAPGTIYRGVHKLRAASMLHFRDGEVDVRRYWTPTFSEGPVLDPGAAGDRFLGLVEETLRRGDDGTEDLGAFLSGGLDSSTVAGVFSRIRPHADTYTIGFDAEGYDETGYARIVTGHFDLRGHEYTVTPQDVLTALPEVVAAYDEPFGNSSALPALYCARLAKDDGKRVLLAGDGGDELFAGNARYLKQQVFERYGQVPGWFRRLLLEPAVFTAPSKLPLIGKARSYIEQARIPLPDRLQTYNFLFRMGAQEMVHPELLEAVDRDLPLALERELYGHPPGASTLNRMLYLDWHHTLADNDLRKVSRMCELAGIGVSYPLLDDTIVDFSMSVPSAQKIRAGRLRDFYKKAMRGFLPTEILDKRKHGFGLPFGVWTASHPGLKALVQDNLARLERRKMVREDFLQKALNLHQHGHAAYYGELIWVLTVLELWLTSRGFEP